MTLSLPTYTPPNTNTPALGPYAAAQILALQSSPNIDYGIEVKRVDISGNVLEDVTGYVLAPSAQDQIVRDSTALVQEDCTFHIQKDLRWGADLVAIAMLVRDPNLVVAGGVWQRFPVGVYVATTPQRQLQTYAARSVQGYGKNYLLQGQALDSFDCAQGATYFSTVLAVFIAAGIVPAGATDIAPFVRYTGAWAAKTADRDYAFPPSESTQYTYLSIINTLLAASGQRPLWVDPTGQWVIDPQVDPKLMAHQYTFARTNDTNAPVGWPYTSLVDPGASVMKRDVYGIPNQWVFIQQGLTFTPYNSDGSDGRYVVNNVSTQPGDQTSIGRIITATVYLNASGQADLIAQGNAYVTAQLSQAETIDPLVIAPWPVMWHYDVFWYVDGAMPGSSTRKLQQRKFTLPLNGAMMNATAYTVDLQ